MKNILLPSDLSVQSLWPIKKIVDTHPDSEPLTVHVIHMLEMPTSLSDFLVSVRTRKNTSIPYYFKDALQILQSKYNSGSVQIKFEFVYGSTSRVLRNYMEGADIHQAALLEGYKYQFNKTESVDFTGFFKKVNVPVTYIPFKPAANSEFQVLSILLNDEKNMAGTNEPAYQPAFAV